MKKFDMSIFESAERLDEITYKDIMRVINPNDLPHRDYAPLIKYVRYVEMRKDMMKFFVPNIYNGWNTYIQFMDFNEQLRDTSINANECARLLLWSSNIRVHCTCPAFKFWGSEYILTQLDAAIIPENRFPHIRNPHLKGIVCKHLNRTIKTLGFHLGDLASYIKVERQNL
jgi:hypothetical protein